MSIEAVAWALDDAPDVPPSCLAVLIGLANHAQPDGRGAFPSQQRLARYARKSVRAVQNDLATLTRLSLIRRGDQHRATFMPADRRPVVWDLATERRRAAPGSLQTSTETQPDSTDQQAVHRAVDNRGDVGLAPEVGRGEVQYATKRSRVPNGVKQASYEPSFNRKKPNARAREYPPTPRDHGRPSPSRTTTDRCPWHIGELAAHCRPCASERKARVMDTTETLRRRAARAAPDGERRSPAASSGLP